MPVGFMGGFGGQFGNQQAGLPQMAHNEYIVYNTSQIRMRYLVQMKKKQPAK